MLGTVLVIATLDTKWVEAGFLKGCIEKVGIGVLLMDAGIRGTSPIPADITRFTVAEAAGTILSHVQGIKGEGEALRIMTQGASELVRVLYHEGRIQGILGLGGSMGTTLGTGVMRSLPVGFPKVMISTMASRNTRPFVGTKDIMMLHSVCDLSGLNRITRKVLWNGAMAMVGMVGHPLTVPFQERPLVLLTTLGTTESCSQAIRQALEGQGKEVITFHTVGAGGKAMEEMAHEKGVYGVIDLSLHEMADHLFGGEYDAGPERGSSALQAGLPVVFVPGNLDFLVTGPLQFARERFPNRAYHVHNEAISVVRTSREEIRALAERLTTFLNTAKGPWAVLVPMKGLSAFDAEGGPLHDPEAPGIFAETLRQGLNDPKKINPLPFHINDPDFADALIKVFDDLVKASSVAPHRDSLIS